MFKYPVKHSISPNANRLRQEADLLRKELERLKLAEKAHQKYRDLFDQTSDGLVLIDKETADILDFNDNAFKFLGYTREEFKKLRMQDLGLLKTPEQMKMHQKQLRHEKDPLVFITQHKQKNGTIRDILTRSKKITLDNRTCFLSVWTDITKQQNMERELRQKEQELETTLSALKNLLKQVALDKKEIEAKIFSQLENLVAPLLKKSANVLIHPKQQALLQEIKTKLNRLAEKTMGHSTAQNFDLTPKENQVANLIKRNRTSKEIARQMNISVSTVDFHRKNIRKKLNLNNSGKNLKNHFSSHKE